MHAGEEMAAAPATADSGSEAHLHAKPVATADERACLADLTAEAKELTARFNDYAVAVQEGYVPNPGNPDGTHYPNRTYNLDGVVFDLARPETLIYRTDAAGSRRFVGVMYKAPKGQHGPTPCGAATYWHTHTSCVNPTTREKIEDTHEPCPSGFDTRESGEMIHLWFVPRRR
jgi:hypothetical protein